MLIKRSIVEKWYQRDSWVYKNFSYLFSNPLWKKRVPYGFSVCPYFWLSLFSFFIFRPVVVAPVVFGILPLIKLIGWPAEKFDRFLYKKFFRTDCNHYSPGVATLGCISIILLLGMAISVIAMFGTFAYEIWAKVAGPETGSTLGRYGYWSACTFIGMWGVIGIHKAVTKSECKTHYYIFPWFLLFIIGSFVVIPTEMFTGIGVIFSKIWWFIANFCAMIWWGISSAAVLVGSILWSTIKYAPVFGMSWVLLLVYLTILGYLGTKLMALMDYWDKKNIGKGLSESERIAQNRRAWLHLFHRVLMQGEHWKKGKYLDDELFSRGNTRSAYCTYQYEIMNAALEKYLDTTLTELQKSYPHPDMSKWKDAMETGAARWGELGNLTGVTSASVYFDNSQFSRALREVVDTGELGDKIKAQKQYLDSLDVKIATKKVKRNESWSHKMCLKITAKIGIAAERMWTLICSLFANIGVFSVYLWTLLKAKKTGVCPYIAFSDPQPDVAPTTTVAGK